MGARFPFGAKTRSWTSWRWFLSWLALYGTLWAALALFALAPGASEPKLVTLLAWGGGYFAVAIYLAHDATERIRQTVLCDIVEHATEDYEKAVAGDLHIRYPRGSLSVVPFLVAVGAVEAAWWAIEHDIGRPWDPLGWLESWESAFWAVSYMLYFFTAGVVVIAARFYSSFAEQLAEENTPFYVLGAADTPLVKGLSKLNSQVLGFWASIFFLILTSMLLAVIPAEDYRLDQGSLLLFLMVPTTGFFSLGFGALVYLRAEARIRATLHRFTHKQAELLQEQSNAIFDPGRHLVPKTSGPLDRLTERQGRILAGGRYGSRAAAGLSIAMPLALPVVSLIVTLLK